MKDYVLLLGFLLLSVSQALTVKWIDDSINVTSSTERNNQLQQTLLRVRVNANGVIYAEHDGHFRLSVEYTNQQGLKYSAESGCIDFTSPGETVSNRLQNIQMFQVYGSGTSKYIDIGSGPAFPLSKLYLTSVKRYFSNYTGGHHTFDTTFEILFGRRKNITESLQVALNNTGCSQPRTIGFWDDARRWNGGVVPGPLDSVEIGAGAGVVRVSRDVTVASLSMDGGLILNYDTYCPQGWSAEPEGVTGIKCYKMYENPSTFAQAERTCNAGTGFGSENRHLMHVRGRDELLTATRLCRGHTGSAAHSRGCWLGLRDPLGVGDWRWVSPLGVGDGAEGSTGTFLDWRRDEPNNHSISEGVSAGIPSAGGERCAALVPWQEDPLLLEQGSWNDESCEVAKPFLCQVYGTTRRYTITVSGAAALRDGALEGGLLNVGTATGVAGLYRFAVSRSGRLLVDTGATDCVIGTVLLTDGAALEVQSATARTQTNAFIGEPVNEALVIADNASPSFLPLQPFLRVGAGTTVTFAPLCGESAPIDCNTEQSTVTVSARAFVSGTLNVTGATNLLMLQGADMAKATVQVLDEQSHVRFAGYNSRLSTYDSYELQVGHRGEVVGEFYRDFAAEQANQHLQQRQGVYRLRVENTGTGTADVSQCIPYNATAEDLRTILNALSVVQGRGNTTVRRYGSAVDPDYLFGYTYRIQLDSVATASYAQGPLLFSMHCYGFDSNCGCAETKVVMVDVTGMPECSPLRENRTSHVDSFTCVLPPTLSIAPLAELAHTVTSGAGSIEVREGVHRLPPLSACTLAVTAGVGVVASNLVQWSGISVTNVGRLIVAGTGWDAWDSTYALYAPEWFTMRGRVRSLDNASPVNMFVTNFYLAGLGTVLSSCPNSQLAWTTGTWAGGILGGRSTLYLTDMMQVTGTGKSLRYGLTLVVQTTAVMQWTAGNISLGDGADIIVEGKLRVNSTNKATTVFIGEAQLLQARATDIAGQYLLQQEAGRSYHSYYGDELPAELRGGWYYNPLCGDQCGDTNHLIIQGDGIVEVTDATRITFSLPIDLVDRSRLNIGSDVIITLASGGTCGNLVVVDISSGTVLELSGGQMLLDKTCTIQGQGELLVSAGSHDLSFSIDAHITIQGGSMVWPLSRGTKGTISFNGGLLMQNTGELQVNPFSTTILIKKEVHLKDQSLIQFPLIGIAAQASLFDEQDAPDPSPRGNLTVTGIMRWEGGTLRGKADFNALDALFLDGGTKYIKSLAKLVNKGHCEWGTGDLISSDGGDMLNFGTVQMKDGVKAFFSNAMYQGTELPIESGGDLFALNYHSWDMDNGGLDYTKYVQERTAFVSRAPNGWTVASQG